MRESKIVSMQGRLINETNAKNYLVIEKSPDTFIKKGLINFSQKKTEQ